jgi:predicted acetyltransferase
VDVTIRRATGDDYPALVDLDSASFGYHFSEQELADTRNLLDLERFWLAVDGDRIVGVTGDFAFTMTVPGGQLEVPGVTWVSVDATYRRTGVLRSLMERQLDQLRADGYACAILTASESGIYGRFGYGAASHVRKTVIPRRRLRLLEQGNARAVSRAATAEARKAMPEIHERWRQQTPGALSRSEPLWDYLTLDREYQHMGMSALFYLLHDDGYVAYRIKSDWNDGDPSHLCWISDYVCASPRAHRDLWQVLLGLDLVGSIESYRIPLDDPLQYLVNDPRQVRTTHVGDGVWIRPLDVPALLASRCYSVEVDVVVGVTDAVVGDGCYRLRGGPDGAQCEPASGAADIELDAATLGSVYLGGVRLEHVLRAGRGRVDNAGAAVRLDRALLADRLPQHGTAF